ncbi:MAG: hypothetical protein DRP56_05335 [Planctomycetota bacterium]|nr:MAG: hypothetical protein DRP56_05335 [Planctomycetota bacterium]
MNNSTADFSGGICGIYETTMTKKKKTTRKSVKKTGARAVKKKTVKKKAKKTPRQLAADKRRAAVAARELFLVQLAELAAVSMPPKTAAEHLQLTEVAFEAMLAADVEAARLWHDGRRAFEIEMRRQLKGLAEKGNAGAIRQILAEFEGRSGADSDAAATPAKTLENWLGEKPNWVSNRALHDHLPRNVDHTVDLGRFLPWFADYLARKHTFDATRMKMVDLQPILAVSKTTLIEWTKAGMPRNADGSFSLAAAVGWRVEQVGARPEKPAEPVNPLHQLKAEKLQIEVDAARGKLIDRAAVMSGLLARAAAVMTFIDRKGGELPTVLAGQKAEPIKEILDEFFDRLRDAARTVPEEIESLLSDKRRKLLAELMGDDFE